VIAPPTHELSIVNGENPVSIQIVVSESHRGNRPFRCGYKVPRCTNKVNHHIDLSPAKSQTPGMAEKGSQDAPKKKRESRLGLRLKPTTKDRWERAAHAMGDISLSAWVHIACEKQCKDQGIK
jgi:hypothetical protein